MPMRQQRVNWPTFYVTVNLCLLSPVMMSAMTLPSKRLKQFSVTRHQRIVNNLLSESKVAKSVLHCGLICLGDDKCGAATFMLKTLTCRLHTNTWYSPIITEGYDGAVVINTKGILVHKIV